MTGRAVLLTGATGFVGMEVLARYLERSDRELIALIRAGDDSEAGARLCETLATLYGDEDGYAARVTAVAADVWDELPLRDTPQYEVFFRDVQQALDGLRK